MKKRAGIRGCLNRKQWILLHILPMWSDENKFHELKGIIQVVQQRQLKEGKIDAMLDWGFDLWGWDRPHYQVTWG